MENREPDYLDHLIQISHEDRPGFSELWEPVGQMLALGEARVRIGLSQQDVADRMGIDRAAVSRMETNPGRVAFERILRYAHAVGAEIVIKPGKGRAAPLKTGRGRKPAFGSKANLTD